LPSTVNQTTRLLSSRKESSSRLGQIADKLFDEAHFREKQDLPPNIQVSKSFFEVSKKVQLVYALFVLFFLIISYGVTVQHGFFQFEPVYDDPSQDENKKP
jgi:hypothetical protein